MPEFNKKKVRILKLFEWLMLRKHNFEPAQIDTNLLL